MKKTLKSLLAISICLIMAFAVMPITSFAYYSSSENQLTSGSCGTNATYSFSNSTLTISGTGKITSYDIGDSPFAHAEEVKKIVVKEGITSLGEFCFYDCKNVTEIILPKNSLTEIKNGAFCNCNSLTYLTIPSSVKSIGYMNIEDCINIEKIYYMGTVNEFKQLDYSSDDWSGVTVSYHSHKNSTTVTKATLTKNGKKTVLCSVCGKKVSSVFYYPKTIKLSATSYKYDGKVKTPSVTLKNSKGVTLKKGTDYTVTYASGRKKVGSYKVTVKFKGNYSGTKTLTFKINPQTPDSVTILPGKTKNLNAKSSHKITYSSSKKSVATVSKKGVITAKKKGTAYITVKSNKITKKIKVVVKNPYIKLNLSQKTITKNNSVTIKATTLPGNVKITWSSSNSKVAKVNSKGKVTGVKIGTAVITAKFKYKGKTYKKTCKIKVSKLYTDNNPHCKVNILGTPGTGTKIWIIGLSVENLGNKPLYFDQYGSYSMGNGIIESGCIYHTSKFYEGNPLIYGEKIKVGPGKSGIIYISLEDFVYYVKNGSVGFTFEYNGKSGLAIVHHDGSGVWVWD